MKSFNFADTASPVVKLNNNDDDDDDICQLAPPSFLVVQV